MMYKLTKCALCAKERDLELSHIVPKFVVRKLKKTSAGKIRSTENPNVPTQDSEKHYMLCSDCENLFSTYETIFANRIFHPYLKKESDAFEYDEWLNFFLTSVSWRSLYMDLMDFVQNNILKRIETLECLINCESIMRSYLLKYRTDIGIIENHVFFFDTIKEISGTLADEFKELRPHTTFHRGITSYSFAYEDAGTYGTITNMMGIILITLYHKGKDELWKNTLVSNKHGIIQAGGQHIQSVVGNELTHILKVTQESQQKLTEVQKQKIIENIKNAGEKITEFDIFTDIVNDHNLENY